jgi:hypothetical protein
VDFFPEVVLEDHNDLIPARRKNRYKPASDLAQ